MTRLIYFFALASGLVAGFAIPVTADVTGWFWEKTVDNGNKLFAVCTPTAAEQDGADLSPVWSFRLVVVPRCQAIHSTGAFYLSFAPV